MIMSIYMLSGFNINIVKVSGNAYMFFKVLFLIRFFGQGIEVYIHVLSTIYIFPI